MLLDFRECVRRHNVQLHGIVHVGAHRAEERDTYGSLPVWWCEGNADLIPDLERILAPYPNQHLLPAMCADGAKQLTFNLASNGESSSLLPPDTHLTEHPEVRFTGTREVQTTTVDALVAEHGIVADCLVMDAQGAEALILEGARLFLSGCQSVYQEVSTRPLYYGTLLLPDMVQYMARLGFELRELRMTRHGWGDSWWVRA